MNSIPKEVDDSDRSICKNDDKWSLPTPKVHLDGLWLSDNEKKGFWSTVSERLCESNTYGNNDYECSNYIRNGNPESYIEALPKLCQKN